MERRKLLAAFLAAVVGLGLIGNHSPIARAEETDEDDRTLLANPHFDISDCMKLIGKAYKKLSKQVKDAGKKESSLELLSFMQAQIVLAKVEEPKMLLSASADDRAKGTLEFRTTQLDLLDATIKAEREILADKLTDAAATVEKMKEIQKKGHDKFKPKEEK